MDTEPDRIRHRVKASWLRGGEPLDALATCRPLAPVRYRVPGLDDAGQPLDRNLALRPWDRLDDLHAAGSAPTVRGAGPDCLAVGFAAAVTRHTWLALTPLRLAVVEVEERDSPPDPAREPGAAEPGPEERAERSSLGGLAKAVTALVTERWRTRPGPASGPGDSAPNLAVHLEWPRAHLASTVPVPRYEPRSAPTLRLIFTDRSWVKIETTADGAATLGRVT